MNDHPQPPGIPGDPLPTSPAQHAALPGNGPGAAPQFPASADNPLDVPPPRSGPPAAAEAAKARPAAASAAPRQSKSQRVREFLHQHPEARNKAVAEALAAYGVTPADVGNVKTQLKRKAEEAAPAKRQPRSAQPAAPAPAAAAAASAAGGAAELSLTDLEQVIAFIRQIGSIHRARQALDLVEQIRQIRP